MRKWLSIHVVFSAFLSANFCEIILLSIWAKFSQFSKLTTRCPKSQKYNRSHKIRKYDSLVELKIKQRFYNKYGAQFNQRFFSPFRQSWYRREEES